MKQLFAVAVILALSATGLWAQEPPAQTSGDKWLHVRVEKAGEDGEFVRVNVPLSLAEAVLPTIEAHNIHHGKVRFRHHSNDIDIRALLAAVKDTQDGEFVTIEKKDETVRVAKEGGFLLVTVNESKGEKPEQVHVKVPMVVAEALLSGEEDELNLTAAIKALRQFGDIELVSVRDGDETVRVWIDSKNTGE
jgi:hypothetical protein